MSKNYIAYIEYIQYQISYRMTVLFSSFPKRSYQSEMMTISMITFPSFQNLKIFKKWFQHSKNRRFQGPNHEIILWIFISKIHVFLHRMSLIPLSLWRNDIVHHTRSNWIDILESGINCIGTWFNYKIMITWEDGWHKYFQKIQQNCWTKTCTSKQNIIYLRIL